MTLPIHPACALWPRPPDDEVLALAKDIQDNGLLNPIWLFEGAILDGKTRHEACCLVDVEPRFETYSGNDVVGFVLSQNLKRRHLPKYELSFIGEELARLKQGSNQFRKDVFENTSSNQTRTMVEIGDQLGVSRQNIESVRQLKRHGEPRIIEMAKTGKVGVQNAARYAIETPREKQRTATLETVRKFREERRKPQLMITIPQRDMIEKFRPLVKRVKEQSKRHAATVSFTELSIIAHELGQLADAWMENGSEPGTRSDPVPLNRVRGG